MKSFVVLWILCISISLYGQNNSVITPQNCSCYGYSNGKIAISNVSDNTEVNLSKIEGQTTSVLFNYSKTREFIDLNPGNYVVGFKDGENLSNVNIDIGEPEELRFEVNSPTVLPKTDTDSTGVLSINALKISKPYTIFYKRNGDLTYKSSNLGNTISGLLSGTYTLYVEKGSCRSGLQTVVLPVQNMFELAWHQLKYCDQASLEFELILPTTENVSVTYEYENNSMGIPELVQTSNNVRRYKISWLGFGKYKISAVGIPATRVRTLTLNALSSNCSLICNISGVVKPNPSDVGEESFTLNISNPKPGNYSVNVEKNGKNVLTLSNTPQTAYTIKGRGAGNYSYKITSLSDMSTCSGVFNLTQDIISTDILRKNYIENVASPAFRELAMCECYVKRVNSLDLTLRAIGTIPTLFVPALKATAAAYTVVIAGGVINTADFFSLKKEKYQAINTKRKDLMEIERIHTKIFALFANQTLTPNQSAEYQRLLKEFQAIVDKSSSGEFAPDCPQGRFLRLVKKRFPEGLKTDEVAIFMELYKRPSPAATQ